MLFYVLIFVAVTDVIWGREIEGCVHAHNVLRRLHINTGDVIWDDSLAAGAGQWAKHLVSLGRMKHSSAKTFGENLYWKQDQKRASCEEGVLAWYNEIADYSYATTRSKNGKPIGHFTQVVWKSSTKIGVGIATKKAGNGNIETYIVARYVPKGNFVRMHWGESYSVARRRVYGAEVQPRKPGAKTPTLYELKPNSCKDGLNGQCELYKRFYTCRHKYVRSNCPKKCRVC